MIKLETAQSTKGTSEWFTGEVWIDQICIGLPPSRIRINSTHFAPGARTAWHMHSLGQTLHVTEGIGIVGAQDGSIIIMRPGETVQTAPHEWHWHGAIATHFMTHLAIWEGTEDPTTAETTWGQHLTENVYYAAAHTQQRPGESGQR